MKTVSKKIYDHFRKKDTKLATILEEIDFEEWFENELPDSNLIFKSLCRTIVGQQLAGKAARAIYTRFETLLNGEMIPENVLSLEPEKIRGAGLSWAKVRSVTDLSQKVKNREIHLEKLYEMENEEVIEELVKVKGIGRWTAEMFMMFNLGREDIFSWGDLGLKNGLKKYIGSENVSEEEMKKVVENWSPYKTFGAIAMWTLADQMKI